MKIQSGNCRIVWTLEIVVGLVILFFASSRTLAQSPNAPTILTNELTQRPIDYDTKNVVVFIHGWNPGGVPDAYAASSEWSDLKAQVQASLAGSEWALVLYHWEKDANTGFISFDDVLPTQHAADAANNAYENGLSLASLLLNSSPEIREVHFIAHSAGTWAAYSAALSLLQNDPYVVVELTLLDPFIPQSVPFPLTPISPYNNSQISDLALSLYQSRIFRLENYYADDSVLWNGSKEAGPTLGTQDTFTWRSGIDINQIVDWGTASPGADPYLANYDWHSGPIQFYSDDVQASLGHGIASGLTGSGCPFTYNEIGWYRSLFYERNLLPQIITQPQNKTVSPGDAVTLSVGVANPSSCSFQWYRNGSLIVGANNSAYSYTASADAPTPFVVRVGNANGPVFSDKAVVSVYGNPGSGAGDSLAISSISPATLTGLPVGQTQLIRIIGSGFTSSSTLTFNDGVNSPYTGRIPSSWSANELDYYISVGTSQANWTVQVVNGSQTSNLGRFIVNAPTSSTGTLVVNLSPAGAVSAGAQWQVDGTGYNSSGQVVGYLTPGSHTVSFKPISGYTTPAKQIVTINANAQTTTSGAYSAVAPSTYTLTLNQGGSTGYIVNQPFGSGSGNVYTAGAVVQLTANAGFGYHFVSWGGDAAASGTQNPTTIVMNGNKSVSANFATGDPNLGTIIVTIQPPEAAAAGMTWGLNDNDFRASGTSYSYYPETVWVKLHPTNGWVGAGGWVTFTAGQTTNYTFTASYLNGSIIGSDPRAYYTLAGLATNSGSADGVGSAARFDRPWNIAIDSAGNAFVSDSWNDTIRKITLDGTVSTLAGLALNAGSADGTGTNARFSNPIGIAVDKSGNVYVGDFNNDTVRKITSNGTVTTLAGLAGSAGSADGSGSAARFNWPSGVAVDSNGNVFVADCANQTIRKITPAGVVSTIAGQAGSYGDADGIGSAARFFYPNGVAVDNNGNLYVTEETVIRKITPDGAVTTLAGFPGSSGASDGTGSAARFNNLNGIAVDTNGNIYVADDGNDAIRKVTPAGVVTTLAGQSGNPGSTDGTGSTVRFNNPTGVAFDASGNLFIADAMNDTIRATEPLTNKVDQFISFAPLADKSAGDPPFMLTATTSSGLPVYFSILSGPAILNANSVTLAGAGTVTVVAYQPGNSNYNAAATVQRSFSVSKIPQTITFGTLSPQKVGDAPFPLNATASSGLPVSYSISGPATLNGNILTLTSYGTVTVTASQTGNNTYAAAANVVQSFTVAPPDNTLVSGGFQAHGGFQMDFYGLTGNNYTIQTSSNLLNWEPFTNFVITNSPVHFNDSTATNFNQRFYRVVLP